MSEASDGTEMPQAAKLQEARRKQQLSCVELPRFPDEAVADDFFGTVVEYLQKMTDAPREFLFVSMFMTAVAVIGNRVSMQVGSQRVKPNLYGICLAGSTVGRKTTAVSFCTRYLRISSPTAMQRSKNWDSPKKQAKHWCTSPTRA